MDTQETVTLKRDVSAAIVPAGTRVTLLAGETAQITQALGGNYTVVVNGNLFRIDGRDADALGFAVNRAEGARNPGPASLEAVEKEVWERLRSCYDPEIPVNIVDLGLIYSCIVEPIAGDSTFRVEVKMTLTAPGCGMGPVLQQDVQNQLLSLEDVDEVNVELVWEPPWSQAMMTEAAKLQLGLY